MLIVELMSMVYDKYDQMLRLIIILRIGEADAVNQKKQRGTKVAAVYSVKVPPGSCVVLQARMYDTTVAPPMPFGADFDEVFQARIKEADEFYDQVIYTLSAFFY